MAAAFLLWNVRDWIILIYIQLQYFNSWNMKSIMITSYREKPASVKLNVRVPDEEEQSSSKYIVCAMILPFIERRNPIFF